MKSAKQFWLTVLGLIGVWAASVVATIKHINRKRKDKGDRHG